MPDTATKNVKPIPQPEPGLTSAEVIARAIALRPKVLAQADEAEARGGYTDELHREFTKAGFYRMTTPKMFGGYEFPLETYFKVIIEISRGDPGTGWNLALGASHGWMVASHWSEEAQRLMFGADGHFVCPARALDPNSRCEKLPGGGYRLSGQWNYCSGSTHSTHFIGLARAFDEAGNEGPPIWAAVERSQYQILDDWGGDKVMGMRSSGSNSIRIENATIPECFVVRSPTMFFLPEGDRDGTPGTRLHGNPMYLGQLMGPFHCSLTAPVIGAALAAADEFEKYALRLKTYEDPTLSRADSDRYQRKLGEAMAMADAAEMILVGMLRRHRERGERWARGDGALTPKEGIGEWALIQRAGKLASEAVDLMFRTGGSMLTRKGNRLQRCFNDAQMYRGHMSSQYEEFAGYLGRMQLGRKAGLMGL
ncbi:MAG TPA: acyl-CoA dehydrogenase family protein [Stellaceae bacterium]|nr:acyl-CoA dehydrogenase family protein [Stellaceae bacterium]